MKEGKTERKLKIGCGAITAVAALAVISYYSLVEWIPAGHVGLVYNASGGLDQRVYKPQRLFLWPWQTLYTYPTTLQAAIYSNDATYGDRRAGEAVLVTTGSGAQTLYDLVVYYRVRPENVPLIIKEFGPIELEQVQSQHIRRFVKEAASAIGNRYDVFELMGGKRNLAAEEMKSRLDGALLKRGITIEHVFLLSPQPQGENVKAKILASVNSKTALTTSMLRNRLAEYEAQIAVVNGKAEARSRSIVAAQSSAKSIEMQRLELSEAAVDAWNGMFPPIQPNGKQTIILNGSDISTLPDATEAK
ncbi:MAG: SPFH domain-containing protein [Fimbriimonas sp.]